MCLYIFKQLNWLANIFVYIVSFFSKINKLLLPLYLIEIQCDWIVSMFYSSTTSEILLFRTIFQKV